MTFDQATALVMMALFVAAVLSVRRRRRVGGPGPRRGGIGPGASGAIYEFLNEDKRRAIEVVLEERAAARDPETADGNLPDLEQPPGHGEPMR